MKKFMLLCCLMALFTLTFTACSSNTATTDPTPTPAVTATPAPEVSPTPQAEEEDAALTWEKLDHQEAFVADDGTSLVFTIYYTIPAFSGSEPGVDAINQYFYDHMQELHGVAQVTAVWATEEYQTALASGLDFTPYLEELSFTCTKVTDDYVSLSRSFYGNYGGAHPTALNFSEQFSLETGAQLMFADFFAEDALSTVQAMVVEAAVAEGLLESDALTYFNQEQFYVTDDGFVFWYQGGAFAALNSPLEIAIPYSTVEDLVVLW